ncbi:Flp family type IVb pilin [Litorimonas sp.]|jgi:pilus assembly protein Flp/PilA|uniref:Flp family type IVb pilin n=1 Tax=Litorimonas sp. TaxID=1892381 RepID=UPI003A8B9AD4
MQNLVNRFIQDESGATAIEYGLIAALIAVALIGGATQLGSAIDTKFNDAATSVSGATENTGTSG